jgi:hypothetical protein
MPTIFKIHTKASLLTTIASFHALTLQIISLAGEKTSSHILAENIQTLNSRVPRPTDNYQLSNRVKPASPPKAKFLLIVHQNPKMAARGDTEISGA